MELKEDEQAPDDQPMDVVSSHHSDNQIASSKLKSRPSIAGQLAASRLVKKARLSLLPRSSISSSSTANKPASSKMTVPGVKPVDLSKETIDFIFKSSVTLPNFATHLMTQLFDQSELLKCRNVYGRSAAYPHQIQNPDEALDERRVNIIRRCVEEKVGASDQTWKQCVNAMNTKIGKLRAELRPTEKRWLHVFELKSI